METSVKERLIKFLDFKKISKTKFGETIGVSPAYVTSMRDSISREKIEKIKNHYPELDIEWLLTGKGEMLKTGINQEVNGDHNTAVAGNNNTVNSEELISRLIKLLEKKDEQIAEKDIQMNRLISLLEERKG
jgi:septum formation inhibitor-activating ATPase MinD